MRDILQSRYLRSNVAHNQLASLVYRSFLKTFSFNNLGSSSLATTTTKKARTLSENVTQPFCNDFWSISSHLTCEVFVQCAGVKLRAVWRLEVMSNKLSGYKATRRNRVALQPDKARPTSVLNAGLQNHFTKSVSFGSPNKD